MGLLDRFKRLDRAISDHREELRGRNTRAMAGVDWPRASDPDGIDVLRHVSVEGHPFRRRSEGSDASGYEFRQREIVEAYDTAEERYKGGFIATVVWVEVLHRPYFDETDRLLLTAPYDFSLWRRDADDMRHLTSYLPQPYAYGRVPATGDPCLLIAVEPAVLRFRGGSIDVQGDYREYGETATLIEKALAALGQIDREALARWVDAIEPWKDRFDDVDVSSSGSALRGAIDGVRGTLSGEAGRRSEGEDGPGGNLLGRVLRSASDGAGGALARRVLRGRVDLSPLARAAKGRAERQARKRQDRFASAVITHLDVAERGQPGERWVDVTDDELVQVVQEATGLACSFQRDHIADGHDCRYLRMDGSNAAAITFLAPDDLDEALDEVEDAKKVGEWTIGSSPDQWGNRTSVAVGASADVVIAVRLSGVASPMAALKVVKGVDRLVRD